MKRRNPNPNFQGRYYPDTDRHSCSPKARGRKQSSNVNVKIVTMSICKLRIVECRQEKKPSIFLTSLVWCLSCFFCMRTIHKGLLTDQLEFNYVFSPVTSIYWSAHELGMSLCYWPKHFSLWLPVHCSRLNYIVSIACLVWLLMWKQKPDSCEFYPRHRIFHITCSNRLGK